MNTDIQTIVNQLTVAKEFYYKGRPILADHEFDQLEEKLRQLDPFNNYFKIVGTTGERGSKVKHTIPMGSLDQVDNIDQINKWISTSPESEILVSDKLDGNSIAIYYDIDGYFEAAVTRGDGIEGLDITRHVRRMLARENPPFPKAVGIPELVVRAEAIVRKDLFIEHVTNYKNPRNYVAGQLNRGIADQTFIDIVDIVVFDSNIDSNKNDTFQRLYNYGFNIVHFNKLTDNFDFESGLAERKRSSLYELDGLVLEFNNREERITLGFDNLNPKFSVKYKINVDFVQTEVADVEWNVSKDGYLKPVIIFDPVDLNGVTISRCTGFNAKFIVDNKIGPGAIIEVTRSGDVIPKVEKVISTANQPALPKDYEDNYHWSETGVDLIANELPDQSMIMQLVDFFSGIDAPLLKEGNITSLYEAGYTSELSIIKASEEELIAVLGENGTKVFVGLRDRLNGIDEYILAGSLSFFGRGIGRRKIKKLAETYGSIQNLTYQQIVAVDGFESKSAQKVENGLPKYKKFLEDAGDHLTINVYKKVDGDLNLVAVCFTGVRSKDLEKKIQDRGGKVTSSITKETTHLVAKDPLGKSGKLDKARAAGVKIISLDQAEEYWG